MPFSSVTRRGNLSKYLRQAVSLFRELNSSLPCLACHIFVAVEDHLGWKRRMAADLYRDVAPIGIQDMKRVMIHVWHRLLPFQPMLGTDVPHWSLCARDQDQEHPLLNVGLFQMLFGDVMLKLPRTAVDQRNSRRLCPSAHATAETSGQPHQMCVVQGLDRSGQLLPPHAETASAVTRPKICIQNDTI